MASDDNKVDSPTMGGQRMPIKPGEVHAQMRAAAESLRLNVQPFGIELGMDDRGPYIDGAGVHYGSEQGIGPATDDAQYVLDILPDLIAQFLQKNVKYAEVEKGYDLGSAGVIPDLNRKLGILVARLWKQAPTSGEETDEVIGDMIGHLLLMLAKMRNEG